MNNKKVSSSSFDPATSVRPERPVSSEDVVLRGGDRVLMRPLKIGDGELERNFIEALSPTSRRFRFLQTMRSPSDALLAQLTVLDPKTDAAFVAVIGGGVNEQAVGVGRFSAGPDGRLLVDVARVRGITRMHSSDAADNVRMRKFAAHLRLEHETDPDDATLVHYSVGVSTPPH